MTTHKQALNWSNRVTYWVLAALAAGRDADDLIGEQYAHDSHVDEWDVSGALANLHRWDCRNGREVTPFGHELLAALAERYDGSAPLKADDKPTATDVCRGCGRDLYFDEGAEVYRLADDPDAIFCGDGTDSHVPAEGNEARPASEWGVLDYDGNLLPGTWPSEAEATDDGLCGRYLLSGAEVMQLDAEVCLAYTGHGERCTECGQTSGVHALAVRRFYAALATMLDRTPSAEDEVPTTRYVAVFPKAQMADEFAERVTLQNYGCTNVEHRTGRRKVEFDGPDTREYRLDIAETIGFFGSPPMGPVATLDGNPTPRSY